MQDFWSIPSFMAASVGDMMLCTPTRRCRPRVLAVREVLEALRRDGSRAAVSNRIASFAERQCLVRKGGLGRASLRDSRGAHFSVTITDHDAIPRTQSGK